MFRFLTGWFRRHPFLFGGANLIAGLIIGFGLGVYTLPILIAEDGLSETELAQITQAAEASGGLRSGTFTRDLEGSDAFHWGEGKIYADETRIWLDGKVSPGPDYRLYLIPEFVETEAAFYEIKDQSAEVGLVNAFENFSLDLPKSVNPDDYKAVIVWCERFGEFITAAELN